MLGSRDAGILRQGVRGCAVSGSAVAVAAGHPPLVEPGLPRHVHPGVAATAGMALVGRPGSLHQGVAAAAASTALVGHPGLLLRLELAAAQ